MRRAGIRSGAVVPVAVVLVVVLAVVVLHIGPGWSWGKSVVNVVIIGGTLAVLAGLGRVVYMVATGAAIKALEPQVPASHAVGARAGGGGG